MAAEDIKTPNTKVENTTEGNTSSDEISNEQEKNKKKIKETFKIKDKKMQKRFNEEMEKKFGKDPTQENVVNHFKGTDKYKDMNYKQIIEKLKEDNKPMAERFKKNVKDTIIEEKDREPTEEELKKKLKEEDKEEKKEEKKAEDTKKNAVDETKKQEEKKEEKEEESPKKKRWKGFFSKLGKGIAWPFKKGWQATKRTGGKTWQATKWTAKAAVMTPISVVQSAAKTVRAPVGLTSYLLAYKSKEGRKKRSEGYKNHWKRVKK